MKSSPLVSVNIRTLNSAKTLEETLLSVKNQTYSNVEIIVSDGYSKDESVEIAKKYGANVNFADKLGDARHQNYKKSKGKYLLSLDSDQKLDLSLIETCVKKCENNNFDALVISEKSVLKNNTLLERLIAYDKWIIDQSRDIDAVFGTACPRFFRRRLLSEIKWPAELSMFDDAILYAEILKKGAKVGYISDQSIRHQEVSSWLVLIKKFFRYGKGYLRALGEEPSAIAAHSLPRRSYFSRIAFSKPHYFLGLMLLYSVKALSASSGALVYFFERLFKK